jgi:hypothetical protein
MGKIFLISIIYSSGRTTMTRTAIFLIFLTGVSIISWAGDGYFGFKAGIVWPQTLHTLEGFGQRNAWNLGLEWGGFPHKYVGIGGSFGVVWKKTIDDTTADSLADPFGGTIIQFSVDRSISRVMFPLQLGVSIDPLADFFLHPVLRAGGGPAMMIYTNRHYTDSIHSKSEYTKASGVYWGFTGHVGADLMLNLGEEARLFFGAEYQFSMLSKREWGTSRVYRQDMSGPAVHIGVRVR